MHDLVPELRVRSFHISLKVKSKVRVTIVWSLKKRIVGQTDTSKINSDCGKQMPNAKSWTFLEI